MTAGFWLATAAVLGSSGASAATVLTSGNCKLELPLGWTLRGQKAKLADNSTATLEVTFDPDAFIAVLQQRSNAAIEAHGESTVITMSKGGTIKEVHGVSSGVGAVGKACHVEISVAGPASVGAARSLAAAVRHP